MTIIRDDLFAITGARLSGQLIIKSKLLRPGTVYDGAITPWSVTVPIRGGFFETPNLDPGPAEIEIRAGSWSDHWDSVNIPDQVDPISLTAVLEMYSEYEPGVISEAWQAATAARVAADEAAAAAAGVDVAVGVLMVARDEAVDAAATATGAAQTAADDAVDAVVDTVTAAVAADRATAQGAATEAAGSATSASASANAAMNEATAAATSTLAAADYASDAAESSDMATLAAGTATSEAGAATTQAGLAADAATAADGSATAAAGSATAAATSEQQAELWKIAAEEAAGQSQSGAPAGGWPRTDLATDVRSSLTRADDAATPDAVSAAITAYDTGSIQPLIDALWDALGNDAIYAVTTDDKIALRALTTDVNLALSGKSPTGHGHTIGNVDGLLEALALKASITAMNGRPAMFSGTGAPPASIPNAAVGDNWLDLDSGDFYRITGV